MKVSDAFKSLTAAARRESVELCVVQLQALRIQGSYEYVKQVMQGIRVNPCSAEVARVISAHFRGFRGIDVSPEDVNGVSETAIATAKAG